MQVDKQLWTRVAEGDQQAYAAVYRFYYRRFYNYGKKFTDDAALIEDSIHEVLLTIWDKRHTLYAIEHAGTYFYTTFRHALLQKLKRQNKIVSADHQEGIAEFGVDQLIISKETEAHVKEQLQRALNTLTPRQREAIFLRFYENLPYEQVALILDITVKATYKIVARALSQLKDNLLLTSVALLGLLGAHGHNAF